MVAVVDGVRVFDSADVVEVDAAEVLAEVQVLDLALGVLADVLALLVEEFDINHARVEGREAHMDAARRVGCAT